MAEKRTKTFLVLFFFGIFLANCGGGSSGSSGGSKSFSIAANPSQVSISPGTNVQVHLTLMPQNGFSGAVTANLSGLPGGVSIMPASPFQVPASGLTLNFTADSNVVNGTYSLTLQGSSGSLSSSTTISLTVEPLASFSLNLISSNLVVNQGSSTSGQFDISSGAGSTNFSVNLSATGLPSGVAAMFSQNPLSGVPSQQSITLTATSTATLVQNATAQLIATRASDGATASANFTLTVAPPIGGLPGNRTGFMATDDTPTSIVFDSIHKVLYAALPHREEVEVIDPSTGQKRAIPVPDAQGLSLSPDGQRVLVGGFAQQMVWIDTELQQIVKRDVLPQFQTAQQPMVMSNGKVLLGNSLEWDSVAGTVSPIKGIGTSGIGTRSSDGTKALFASDTIPGSIALYDSTMDSFTATTNYNDFPFAIAANPTGTQFVVAVSDEGIFFLDSQLNTLGQSPVGGLTSGMVYSPDGKFLYLVSTPNNVPLISSIDTNTFQLVAQAPAYASNIAYITRVPPLFVEVPQATDSTGILFGIGDHGVALDDSTFFQNISPSATPPVFAIIASPAQGPPNASTPVSITTQSFSAIPDVWFGNLHGVNPVLNSAGQVTATAPPSTVSGPVNVKTISPDGTEGNIPQGFTYGSVPARSPILATAPSGGVPIEILGYGFGSDIAGAKTQVQVGNQTASIDLSDLFPAEYSFGYPFPLEHIRATVPAGTQGASDIVVTSTAGTATFHGGFHYVQAVNDYASTDVFQFILYDPKRQYLFLSTGDHIDVFSVASHTFLSPITPPSNSGNRKLVWLALTPDSSELIAANVIDNSVAIINPDNPQTAKAVQIVPTGTGNGFVGPSTVAITSSGVAFVTTANTNQESGTTLNLYQLNLSTLQVSPVTIPGNDLFLGLPALVQGSRGGSSVFAYFQGNSGGPTYSWSAAENSWTMERDTGAFVIDGVVSGDGNVFALDSEGLPTDNGTVVTFLNSSLNILARTGLIEYTSAIPMMPGMKLNDAGSLSYVPVLTGISSEGLSFSENAVDIYDVQQNSLRERVLLSEQFPSSVQNGMAIDPTGQEIFLITEAGLTIVTLDSVPLSIGSVTPSSGAAGVAVTIRGSGFVTGIQAHFNGTAGTVTFVDVDTLQATVPGPLPSGAVSIGLSNPDGSTYVLDDAFVIQ